MFESENIFVLIPLAFIALSALAMVTSHIRKYASHRHELNFKRDLVEQGLSVDEIERVVAAKSQSAEK